MSVEKKLHAASGWTMLVVVILGYLASIFLFVRSTLALSEPWGSGLSGVLLMILAWLVLMATIIANCGFFSLQPGQARVCVLFGKYVGTVRDEGFRWANPFYSRSLGMASDASDQGGVEVSAAGIKLGKSSKHAHGSKISTRARTYNGERIKVNDKMGNPIEIATVVVWRVVDTAKAIFDVDDYESFVYTVTETALRHVASVYAYDHMEDDDANASAITLRTNIEEVSKALMEELDRRLEMAGVDVIDSRLTHLAYAPEIAQAMLRRQQAEAIIAARKKIVEGAVGMVDMAVEMLAEGGNIDLDDERKATMATNLMVVLCGESEAQPVLNTGTLYN
ncbi:MAG: SPFH domain-containing protein [Atopobiaceae bacterium]|nr:SPFH domain-containing protein [Atopobiaceae bacterium]